MIVCISASDRSSDLHLDFSKINFPISILVAVKAGSTTAGLPLISIASDFPDGSIDASLPAASPV